jgi:integrase
MIELVRLRRRPTYDGRGFYFFLDYKDLDGERKRVSLGHRNKRKAEKQRMEKEYELRMGYVDPDSMKLSDFLEDSLRRTGDQIRESTRRDYRSAMRDFISIVGDIDYRKVRFAHGEEFCQKCLDGGNTAATVAKKLREVKHFFELAVHRRQVDENPLKYIRAPRWTEGKVITYTEDECRRLFLAVNDEQNRNTVNWGLLILTALETGMRKSELLNLTWRDIDFSRQLVEVNPKKDTKETWPWFIKDVDRRELPLTDEAVSVMACHQESQPEGHPYVFVPPARYRCIQQLRREGRWTYSDSRLKVLNNFRERFVTLLRRANISDKTFHDLRRTALSNWLAGGISEHEVMRLAGHADFATTHKFYLAIADDLLDRAREVTSGRKLAQIWHKCVSDVTHKKGCQTQMPDSQQVM